LIENLESFLMSRLRLLVVEDSLFIRHKKFTESPLFIFKEDHMMKKGIFYLLPLLALTQLGASNASLQVEKNSLLTVKAPVSGPVIEHHGKKDLPSAIYKTPAVPISGRNRIARRVLVVGAPPRAGRNVRYFANGRKLIKRN